MNNKDNTTDKNQDVAQTPPQSRQPRNQSALRRKALKTALAGGAVVTVGSLPTKWVAPVVDSVVLPAHAITSDVAGSGNTGPWYGAITAANIASISPVPGSVENRFTAPEGSLLASIHQSKDAQDSVISRIAGSLEDALISPANAQAAVVGYLCVERTNTAGELSVTLQIELGDGYTANYTGTGMESVIGGTPIVLSTTCLAAINRYSEVSGFFDTEAYDGFLYYFSLLEPDDEIQSYAGILPQGSCNILPENCSGIA